jgi:hypothetical protein
MAKPAQSSGRLHLSSQPPECSTLTLRDSPAVAEL